MPAEKGLMYLINSTENHCRSDLKSVYIFFIQVLHTTFKIAKSRCNELGNAITIGDLSPHIHSLAFSFLVRCSHHYPVALKLLILSQHTEAPKSATPQLPPRLSILLLISLWLKSKYVIFFQNAQLKSQFLNDSTVKYIPRRR